ncbi:hypothetical protein GCM10018793_49110 [Streptomyces sulfonofaciens]|uniref:Glycosyl hydrolase family 12 n=1 Tax=Streptomyces sulfonofaciens TaxID=68272 RepID=A0A919GHG2_9ACTN|nr:hypothetical protein [Streptomyces sulfonofaciens]GHH84527.1 hypothetical protein GCM10018793_49110 [Streptomyces sulfonofaciens]
MARRMLSRFLLAPAAAGAALAGLLITPVQATAAPAAAHAWTSSDQWGTYTTSDGYTLYNNIWGSGAGTQTIWADSSSTWGVTADHPATGGVKSYPNAKKVVNKPLSSLRTLTSGYNVSVPSGGSYNTSYDIWDTDYDYEIMLWVNHNGAVGPLGSQQGTVSLGGSQWTVHKGDNGSNQVFSFLRISDSSSGTVNILPILDWIEGQGWWHGETVGDVQLGYEITSSPGGLDFTTNSFRVSSS